MRLLILSASAGAGHVRAGEALLQRMRSEYPHIRTEHFDVLDYTSRAFKRFYGGSYLLMVNKMPELWGYLYEHSDKEFRPTKPLLRIFDHFNYSRYMRALKAFEPDGILCTHFLPYISISPRLRREGFSVPFGAVTTDFDVHRLWIDPVVARYYVFGDEARWIVRSYGVSPSQVAITGIPIMKEFGEPLGRARARMEAGWEGSFGILISSGGFGVGNVEGIVRTTLNVLSHKKRKRFTVAVVCGRNETLKRTIESITPPHNVQLRTYGFVSTMHQLMRSADLLISKSGGLTSSEAMASGVPMVVVDPIPGQERRNTDVMIEAGAAWQAVNLVALEYKLAKLLENPRAIRQASRNAKRFGKPDAAGDILKDFLRFIRASRS